MVMTFSTESRDHAACEARSAPARARSCLRPAPPGGADRKREQGQESDWPSGQQGISRHRDALNAIGYVTEIIKGASRARRELNPALATELEQLAASIDEASTMFLVGEAGNAILSGVAWPGDPDQ
ncbi:hypothetical protein [Streptacidiphilus anmyonensis]|uniref:hypothetical protein n=1 Tax=Streptacidiphilus anmyonensis TaxID=405782 RepID=UPI0005A8428E|nr:hypothetical protein [Streptacidiphilus anmyonensis]